MGVAGVSDFFFLFFFQMNPSLKKIVFFLGGEGKGGLASVSLFNNKIFFSLFFYWGGGD